MRVVAIPCRKDNYAYLLVDESTKSAALVDVSESEPVLAALEPKAGIFEGKVVAILSTHHHYDHVEGNESARAALGITRLYGHVSDRGRIPGQTEFLEDGDAFHVGRLVVRALHVPGHTTGALAYVVADESAEPVVFTGDTLFIAGCGRLFEGDAGMMHASLSKLAALSACTRVYAGHEYTEPNLRFAAAVEPSNAAVALAQARAGDLRRRGKPTMGTTIGDELSYNPFLRTESTELRATLDVAPGASPAEAFAVIRKAKDSFR